MLEFSFDLLKENNITLERTNRDPIVTFLINFFIILSLKVYIYLYSFSKKVTKILIIISYKINYPQNSRDGIPNSKVE